MVKRKLWVLGLLPVLLMVLAFVNPVAAQAAETWLPSNFSEGQNVYLDPKLEHHRQFPVSLGNLEQRLEQAGERHGLKFYFVMTEMGSEPNGSTTGQKFGAWKLDRLVSMVQNRLPAEDYCIVMVVRDPLDPDRLSIAGQCGNRGQRAGLDHNWFNASNGPLQNNRPTYLPNDPAGYALAIANDVNAGVQAHIDRIAAEERERIEQAERARQHEIFMQKLPGRIGGYGSALLALLLAGLFALFFKKGYAGALETTGKFNAKIKSSRQWQSKLRTDYFGMISEETSWETTFVDETLVEYRQALKEFAEFNARQCAADKRGEEADRLVARGAKFPFLPVAAVGVLALLAIASTAIEYMILAAIFGTVSVLAAIGAVVFLRRFITGFKKAEELVTNTIITVTGRELPTEEADLYGGLVEKHDYTPESLLSNMKTLFDGSNAKLKRIKDAIAGANQNKKDIAEVTGQIETFRDQPGEGEGAQVTPGRLTEHGLNFTPYEERYTALKKAEKGFLAIVRANPLKGFASSEEVEAGVKALKADLERAIRIKLSYADVDKALSAAVARVAEVRGLTVDYSYALVEGEERVMAEGSKFVLDEEDGNPDSIIASARQHYQSSSDAVLAGQLDKAQQEKDAAQKEAIAAFNLVATILAAKDYVEDNVTGQRAQLAKLVGELPEGDRDLADLVRQFLPVNYTYEGSDREGEDAKIQSAHDVADSTAAELAKVKKAYEEQRFLAACNTLKALTTNIQRSIDSLVEVDTRLHELERLRTEAQTKTGTCESEYKLVTRKHTANPTITSAATDNAYEEAGSTLAEIQAAITKPSKQVDWPTEATNARALLAKIRETDKAIDTEVAAYNSAVTEVNELKALVRVASQVDVVDAPKAAALLADARAKLSSCSNDIAREKQDWAAIGTSAEAGQKSARAVQPLAEAEHARNRAAEKINDVAGHTYSKSGTVGSSYETFSKKANLSEAKSYLEAGDSNVDSGQYSSAKQNFDRAYTEAGEAASAAATAAAAALASAIQAHKDEVERQERLRKQREANNNGGGIGGGITHGGGRSGTGITHTGGRSGTGVGNF